MFDEHISSWLTLHGLQPRLVQKAAAGRQLQTDVGGVLHACLACVRACEHAHVYVSCAAP